MAEDSWDPLSPEEVVELGRPYVAKGFLRLNKPALAELIKTVGARRGAAYLELTVLLGLLTLARFSGKEYSAADGAIPGTDAELARTIGIEDSAFRRSVDVLVDRQYLERLGRGVPAGYRVTRPVWNWLQAETMPPTPGMLDEPSPFAVTRRSRRGTEK